MPTYVYECKQCGDVFEVEQRITEDPLTDCQCGGTVKRVIQPVGIAFKGSGFYVNDSSSKPADKTTPDTSSTTPPAESAPKESAPAKPADPA